MAPHTQTQAAPTASEVRLSDSTGSSGGSGSNGSAPASNNGTGTGTGNSGAGKRVGGVRGGGVTKRSAGKAAATAAAAPKTPALAALPRARTRRAGAAGGRVPRAARPQRAEDEPIEITEDMSPDEITRAQKHNSQVNNNRMVAKSRFKRGLVVLEQENTIQGLERDVGFLTQMVTTCEAMMRDRGLADEFDMRKREVLRHNDRPEHLPVAETLYKRDAGAAYWALSVPETVNDLRRNAELVVESGEVTRFKDEKLAAAAVAVTGKTIGNQEEYGFAKERDRLVEKFTEHAKSEAVCAKSIEDSQKKLQEAQRKAEAHRQEQASLRALAVSRGYSDLLPSLEASLSSQPASWSSSSPSRSLLTVLTTSATEVISPLSPTHGGGNADNSSWGGLGAAGVEVNDDVNAFAVAAGGSGRVPWNAVPTHEGGRSVYPVAPLLPTSQQQQQPHAVAPRDPLADDAHRFAANVDLSPQQWQYPHQTERHPQQHGIDALSQGMQPQTHGPFEQQQQQQPAGPPRPVEPLAPNESPIDPCLLVNLILDESVEIEQSSGNEALFTRWFPDITKEADTNLPTSGQLSFDT
ncbi:hypothetical protein B0T25DRAFT_607018 [Lasiosphaeria hispida]|uniref:BZIP domain-containing protein n=1 Tax=Lasiosphaeria hispida TaxID=260671 RepID=A0AAJ0HHP7_9PEZI|nr:hypothetical protein B0T25DRAFT_607018 [Lasiosphaeria hispida]